MLALGHAYLAVRSVVSGQSSDPEAAGYDPEAGAPVLPDGWTATPQAGQWFTLTRSSDGLTIAAWKASSVASEALFALFGPQAFLDAVAATEPRMAPARELWANRADPTVRAYLRYWPVWRCTGFEHDAEGNPVAITDAVRRLVPSGVRIPDPQSDPLPWLLRANGTLTGFQSEASIRVDSITRPALNATLAGFSLHTTAEDEPERAG